MKKAWGEVPVRLLSAGLLVAVLLLAGCTADPAPEPQGSGAERPEEPVAEASVEQDVSSFAQEDVGGDDLSDDEEAVAVRINSVSLVPGIVIQGVDIRLEVEAEIPEDSLSTYRYDWYINDELYGFSEDELLPGDAFERGDSIYVEVTPIVDEREGSSFQSAPFQVVNADPVFLTDPSDGRVANGVYFYSASAEDVEEDELSFFLENAPEGMEVNAETGDVLWAIPASQAGEVAFSVGVRDPFGGEAKQGIKLILSSLNEEGG